MTKPIVGWSPDNGGYYPVYCGRCHRIIGSVDTLAGRAGAIKRMSALHYCSAQRVRLIDRTKLTEAQEVARKRNFEAANELLKQAYTY